MRIYLIGFMGSGKTFTGKQLAERLVFPFIDLDHLIEAEAGMDIPEIFEKFGEDHFRHLEQQALHFTEELSDAVVSTGGGTPCFFDNMTWMNQQGVSIYLDTPVEILTQRLLPERVHRPLLQDYDENTLSDFIEGKLAERVYFYQQAEIVYLQDSADAEIADELIKLINA